MKTIRKGLALPFKTTLLALLIAVLIPTLYFAWRMNNPLPQPEFKGLTYYQFFEWRKLATENAISKYMISLCWLLGHPLGFVKKANYLRDFC
jgi:hypothetical protein